MGLNSQKRTDVFSTNWICIGFVLRWHSGAQHFGTASALCLLRRIRSVSAHQHLAGDCVKLRATVNQAGYLDLKTTNNQPAFRK